MRVLITGGTGSLGQALIRRFLAREDIERIVCFSRDEWKQSVLAGRLPDDSRLRFFLGDVRDRSRLAEACWHCDTVIAAAALKRVDRVAYDPEEVLKTNLLGVVNTVKAACEAQVKCVLVVSSDKSVSASNVYGGSKFCAEMYASAANIYTEPRGVRVAAVRYGNILDARGAVLHTFRMQAATGQPVTVTDARCTRFAMRLVDAVGLIERALESMQGGEVLVAKPPSIRVVDLAEAVAPGVPVEFIGLRPGGEKLHELLLSSHESDRARWLHEARHFVVDPSHGDLWGYRAEGGERMPDGYELRSDTNADWLGVEALREFLGATDG